MRKIIFLLVLTSIVLLGIPAHASSDMVAMHNSARASAGLSQLAVDGNLSAGALAYSQQMAENNKLAHSSPSIRPSGGYRQVVENVGKVRGDTGLSGMFQMFMESATHRPNIMHPDVTHIGVGVATDDRGVIWATVWFGVGSKPKAEPEPEPTPEPTPQPEPKEESKPKTPQPEPTAQAPADNSEVVPTPEPKPEPEYVPAEPVGSYFATWEREINSFSS